MTNDLCAGRVCIVTGSGGGLGRAHADALAAAGGRVVINDVVEANVAETVDAIRAAGGQAAGHVGDASTSDGADELMATALAAFGDVDVVVNNAGIARDRMLINLSEDDWDAVLQVHLKSTFLLTQRAARRWRERSKAGESLDARVINTVSSVGLYGQPGQANYGAAKGAIASFTVIAAMELERYGVTVNALCPTALTPMTEAVGLADSDDAKAGRLDPSWVSAPLVWLASPRSADVTGRVIVASGKRLAIAEGWVRGPTTDAVDDPLAVEDAIRPLLRDAAPNADVQGDRPTA